MREKLVQCKGKHVSIDGYFSTSKEIGPVKMFGGIGDVLDEGHESVFFEIDIHLRTCEGTFANIRRFSELKDEDEYLFDFDSTFEIQDVIEMKESNQSYWLVKMRLSKDSGDRCINHHIALRQLYDSTGFDLAFTMVSEINSADTLIQLHNQLNYLKQFEMTILKRSVNNSDDFMQAYCSAIDKILEITGEEDWSEQRQAYLIALTQLTFSDYFLTLDDRENDALWARRALGHVLYKLGDYQRAIKQFTRTLEAGEHNADPFHIAVCCWYLGFLHLKLEMMDLTIEWFQRALSVSDSLPPIFAAQCHLHIGRAVEKQLTPTSFSLARSYYEKALDAYEKRIQPIDKPVLAICYIAIGRCYWYEQAFNVTPHQFYLKAIEIYECILHEFPRNYQPRPTLAGLLFKIAFDYYEKLQAYDDALVCFKRVINYPINCCPFDSYGLSHQYIGRIYFNSNKQYQQALEHFKLAAGFYENYDPNNYWELAQCYNFIGTTYFKLDEYQLAIDNLQQALDFLLKPKNSTTNNASSTSRLIGMELSYLKTRTGTFPKDSKEYSQVGDDRTIAETYRMIGDAYSQMEDDKIDFALAMYACAYEINQHFTPIYQLDTARTLRGMGDVCCKSKNRLNEAVQYYQDALKVLKRIYNEISG